MSDASGIWPEVGTIAPLFPSSPSRADANRFSRDKPELEAVAADACITHVAYPSKCTDPARSVGPAADSAASRSAKTSSRQSHNTIAEQLQQLIHMIDALTEPRKMYRLVLTNMVLTMPRVNITKDNHFVETCMEH
jgi:hypothetical protein